MTEEIFLSACASHEKIGDCQFTINQLEAAKNGGPLYLCKEGNHNRVSLACLQGEEKQKVLDIVIEERRRRREEAQREFEAI